MVPADSLRSSPKDPGFDPGPWGRGVRGGGGLATGAGTEGAGATGIQATPSGAGD